MTTEQYQHASEHFLAQARRELADGDLPQASEKGWGATAQILKAIAAQRGWEHSRHRHYHRIVSRLRAETGDGDIRRLFAVASVLHENFYENQMESDDVAHALDDVETLLNKLLGRCWTQDVVAQADRVSRFPPLSARTDRVRQCGTSSTGYAHERGHGGMRWWLDGLTTAGQGAPWRRPEVHVPGSSRAGLKPEWVF